MALGGRLWLKYMFLNCVPKPAFRYTSVSGFWERICSPTVEWSQAGRLPKSVSLYVPLRKRTPNGPIRPRAAAAARPAFVRSLTRSRSNAASAPKTLKINRPPGAVVSIFSVSERRPTLRASTGGHGLDEGGQRSAAPIKLPDDESVALADIGERLCKPRPIDFRARRLVGEDAFASDLFQRVHLQSEILVARRDARVSNIGHDRSGTGPFSRPPIILSAFPLSKALADTFSTDSESAP